MKVKEITVSTSRKLGLPGYSSFDVSAFVTVSLEKGDDVQKIYLRAWETVEKQVLSRITDKGLESPVAKEAQDPDDPQDWLEHESPDEQKSKIRSAKKVKEMKEDLKKANKLARDEPKKNVPSIKPTKGGGD